MSIEEHVVTHADLVAINTTLNTIGASTAPVTVTSSDGVITGPITSTTVPTVLADGIMARFDMQGFQSLTVDFIAPSGNGMTFIAEGNNTNQDGDQWYALVPTIIDNPTANSTATLTSNTASIHSYAYFRAHRYIRFRRLTTSAAGTCSFNFQQTIAKVPTQTNGITIGGTQNEGNAYSSAAYTPILNVTRTNNSPTALGGIYTNPTATSGGATLVKPYSVPEAEWKSTSGKVGLATTTSTPVAAAAGATLKNYMTGIQLGNTSATATTVSILDGATEIWADNLPANANISITFHTPLPSSANSAINIQLGTATNVIWSAQGYKAP